MKPENWDTLDEGEKKLAAFALANSMRGAYLLSQALHYAIIKMKEVPEDFQETSNIEDLEMLRETIFTFPVL